MGPVWHVRSLCVSVYQVSKKGILSVGPSVESFGLTKSELWVPEDHKFIVAQCMRFTLLDIDVDGRNCEQSVCTWRQDGSL
jgi:hypothetical protein